MFMYMYVDVDGYVCMYVCMCVGMFVRMYVCLCMNTHMYTRIIYMCMFG